ncbi:MAG: DNA-formamidopyrimidine glycosylase family protein [Promethearchaeati archaeon]
MPELPEVENFRNRIDPIALDKKIKSIKIHDDYIIKTPKKEFKQALIGKEFEETIRRGKYLFLRLDSKSLLVHFAMSGSVKYFNDKNQEPEYSKIRIQFENGDFLSIISVRKLGRVEIIDDLEKYIKENKLGPDSLKLSFKEFKEIMNQKRRSFAKSALMDQKALSGIGNEYSDEILFQAGIYPKTKLSDLDDSNIKYLYEKIKEVLKTSIKVKKEGKKYPSNYLMPHRDVKDKCPKCGTSIEDITVSSRHGYYCPKCQSK